MLGVAWSVGRTVRSPAGYSRVSDGGGGRGQDVGQEAGRVGLIGLRKALDFALTLGEVRSGL